MAAINDQRLIATFLSQRGFTLIEVLVSIFIVAIGVLGLVGLQAQATVAELESYQRAQALILMGDMVDKINNNRGSAGCYAFTDASTGVKYLGQTTGGNHLDSTTCASGYKNANTKARAESDLLEWDGLLQGSTEMLGTTKVGAMVGARGCVSYDAIAQTYTVVVAWQGQSDTFAPTVMCAKDLYGSETKRRAVSTTLRIANLKG